MLLDGQGTKWRRKIAENFNRLSRMHERYRQTTDGRALGQAKAMSREGGGKGTKKVHNLPKKQPAVMNRLAAGLIHMT